MLIPSIDLQGGRIVQLVQGERLAVTSDDVDGWIARFSGFEAVQLIDLDAAKGVGDNDALVRRIAGSLPCRVGGGVRSIARARALLDAGATHVIVGSSLFNALSTPGDPAGAVNVAFASGLADAVGPNRILGAVDSKRGQVVIHGWKTALQLTAIDAVRVLEPFCGGFLYTHVDREGLMQGTDMAAILAVAGATTRRIAAAGGITTREEVEHLHAHGIDAVVGMAIYTGTLALDSSSRGRA